MFSMFYITNMKKFSFYKINVKAVAMSLLYVHIV